MTSLAADLALAFRLARRELRGGLAGFRAFLACLALGVAAIAAVGSLAESVDQGVSADARELFGGDVEARLTGRDIDPEQRRRLEEEGRLAGYAALRAMVRSAPEAGPPGAVGPTPEQAAPAAGAQAEPGPGAAAPEGSAAPTRRLLAELKAVEDGWPLYGRAELTDDGDLRAALARQPDGLFGAVAEERLLTALEVRVGDPVRVGEAVFRLTGVLRREPDRAASFISLGPRLLISRDALAGTGLARPGAIIQYVYRLRLPDAPDAAGQAKAAAERVQTIGDGGWRVRDFSTGSPRLTGLLDRFAMYLTLVGLTAMLVGGVGVAGAVAGHLEGKGEVIATLKSLGAEGRLIFLTYLIQIMILAGLGALAGLLVGAAAPAVLSSLLTGLLPTPIRPGLYFAPLARAAAFGLLTALLFSLRPLSSARRVSPARLFRGYADAAPRRPGPLAWLGVGGTAALLAAMIVLTAEPRRAGWGFVAGAIIAFVLFAGFSRLVVALSRLVRPADPRLRLGLANIGRPGAPTAGVVFALGLGLTALTAVALVDANLQRQVNEQIPRHAPDFFFVDLQPDQLESFRRLALSMGASRLESQPSLRGRITAIGGVPAEQAQIQPEAAWAVRSDRGASFAAAPPPGTEIVGGQWWPPDYAGEPLISLDAELAKGFGLGLGDTLSMNILGREITGTIASLRRIEWASLSVNHAVIFSPGVLEAAPHSLVTAVYLDPAAPPGAAARLFKAATDGFPAVTAVSMREVVSELSALMAKVGLAIRSAAAVTLAAGLLVLGQSLRAGLARRRRETVILKVVGATRRDILIALGAEYLFLGLATASLAAGLGTLAAWAFVSNLLRLTQWAFLPGVALLAALAGVLTTLVLGLAAVWRTLGGQAWPVLRNE